MGGPIFVEVVSIRRPASELPWNCWGSTRSVWNVNKCNSCS